MADPDGAAAPAMDAADDDDDHALSSSAAALTKRLYVTVLDVFGDYAPDAEAEHRLMVETLHQKQLPKAACPTPKADWDARGIVAKRLREGYKLRDDVCDECVMPLMEYRGEVACVVCRKVEREEEVGVGASISSDAALAMASTTWSDATAETVGTAEEREASVERELREFHEKRSQATKVYASKLMEGYVLQEHSMCTLCDMPMMKHQDSVECVFCPKEEPAVAAAAEATAAEIVAVQLTEESTSAKPSQAEAMAARLRNETAESELEKAETELMQTMKTLGITTPHSRDFFSQKKAERAAEKRLKEAEDGLRETELLAASDELLSADAIQATRSDGSAVDAKEEGVAYATAPPVTPRLERGCTIVGALFPRLTKLFANTATTPLGASRPMRMDDVPTTKATGAAGTGTILRNDAKARAAALVAEGWEVSKDNCAHCDLPLFAKPAVGLQRCAVCGPVVGNGNGRIDRLADLSPQGQQAITNEMAHRLMNGWRLVEGRRCGKCCMTVMVDPATQFAHCVACGMMDTPRNAPNLSAV